MCYLGYETDIMEKAATNAVVPESPLLVRVLQDQSQDATLSVRSRQKTAILLEVSRHPGMTRKQLISALGLRPGTVSSLVAELLGARLLSEALPEEKGERGRPEIPLHPNWSRWVAVSVYCVSLELHAVLTNAGDEVLANRSLRVAATASGEEIADVIIQIADSVATKRPSGSDLLGTSLSVPGIVDDHDNRWIFSARWPKLRDLSLGHMESRLDAPFRLQRQLDLQLEYAMFRDPRLRVGNTLLFHWGFGIGGSYSSNGTIIKSRTGVFCQIGHTSVFPRSTRQCICGRTGCLEADAALWALSPKVAETLGTSPENEQDVAFIVGNPEVTETGYFRHALQAVTYAVSHLQAVLVPDRILMYGPFLQNQHVFDALVKGIRKLSPPFVAEHTEMVNVDLSLAWNPSVGALHHFAAAYLSELTSE